MYKEPQTDHSYEIHLLTAHNLAVISDSYAGMSGVNHAKAESNEWHA